MIYRNTHTNDYTVLPNDLLQGSVGLDAESLGVLVYLLSHPSDWRVFGTQIAKHFGMSTDRVTRITKRLESSGYLVRKDVRDAHGWDWDVYDTPSAKTGSPSAKTGGISAKTGEGVPEFPDVQSKKKQSNSNRAKPKARAKLKLKEALAQCPKGVPKPPFEKWLSYKFEGAETAGVKTVNNAVRTFEAMRSKNCSDYDAVVDICIGKGWKSIDPAYNHIKHYFTTDIQAALLAGVK